MTAPLGTIPYWDTGQAPVVSISIITGNGSYTIVKTVQFHQLATGQQAQVSGVPVALFNGIFKRISVLDGHTITYCQSVEPHPQSSSGGTIGPYISPPFTQPQPPAIIPPLVPGYPAGYGYTVAKYIEVPPADSQVFFAYNARTNLDSQILTLGLYGEKIALINGMAGYRFPVQYLWLLRRDNIGPYFGSNPGDPTPAYRISHTDPTTLIDPQPGQDWVPVY